MLALTGAGLALFLVFLLPSLNASRAAGPRGSEPEDDGVEGSATEQPAELVGPGGIELEAEAEEEPEAAVEATAVAATVGGQALVAGETKPRVEGPPLRYERNPGTGAKRDTVDHREIRQASRDKRKERREAEAIEERAFGAKDRTAEGEKFRNRANPDRGRLNRGGTGKQGQGKGKSKG